MATKKTVEKTTIQIHKIEWKEIPIKLIGDTPLIIHAWSEKAKKQMLDDQMKETKTKAKEKRNPVADFINSMYWLEGKPEEDTEEAFEKAVKKGAKWGFPIMSVKMAANSTAYRMGWAKNQTSLRAAFMLTSEWGDMFEIKGSVPEMREDMVKVGTMTKSPDLRYRGEFKNWYSDIILRHNTNCGISIEQIINNIDAGGQVCGLGEWRPERDGIYGTFHVDSDFGS